MLKEGWDVNNVTTIGLRPLLNQNITRTNLGTWFKKDVQRSKSNREIDCYWYTKFYGVC